MNEQQRLIKESLDRLLSDLCPKTTIDKAEKGEFPGELWQALTDTGLALAGLPEDLGGAGGELADSLFVVREAAKFAAPVPLAEHFLAAVLWSGRGETVPQGIMTFAEGDFKLSDNDQLSGTAPAVAFGRWSDTVTLVVTRNNEDFLCCVPISEFRIEEANNIAGEPRDSLNINLVLNKSQYLGGEPIKRKAYLIGAATRVAQMAGALESILEMSVVYSTERVQFGKPIAKFQAIQQQLATMAGEVAASLRAAQSLETKFESMTELEVAIGKSRVGEAVGICTDIAHQVHGAMGYTMEHSFNQRTRRLWAWREEYGSEREWQIAIGQFFSGNASEKLWEQVTLLT